MYAQVDGEDSTFEANLHKPSWFDLIKLPNVKLVSKQACSPPVKNRDHTHIFDTCLSSVQTCPTHRGGGGGFGHSKHNTHTVKHASSSCRYKPGRRGASVPVTCLTVCLRSQGFKRWRRPPSSNLSTASVSGFKSVYV